MRETVRVENDSDVDTSTGSVVESIYEYEEVEVEVEKERRPSFVAYQYSSIGTPLGSIGEEILIKKPVNLCTRRDILYVKMHNHSSLSSDYFEDAVMGTLQKNTFFSEIVTRQPTVFINVVPPEMGKRLPDGRVWYDEDDPLTIGQIKHLYPEDDLMILEVRLQEFSSSEPISITANLIDGYDGSTVLIWRSERAVWYRAEDMQAKKVMREFNKWLENVDEICECQCEKEIAR